MTIREFIPREHGAWAMWIVPMLSAAIVTRFSAIFFLLFVCFALLYTVHHPIVMMLKRKRIADTGDMKQVIAVALPAVLIGIALVWFGDLVWLLLFGAAEIAIFTFSVKSFLDRERRSVFNELTVVAALTLSAPAGYYAITGKLDLVAAVLYALNFLFFGSSIFYVKARIEFLRFKGEWKSEAKKARAMMIAYHLFLVLAVASAAYFGIMSIWILLGFVPMLVQVAVGMLSGKTKMNFTRLGFALVAQSVIFLCVVGVFLR